MTKEVWLRIKGLQFLEGQEDDVDEPVEVITLATYFEKEGRHYIKYVETLEDFGGDVQNLIKIGENSLEVIKKGIASTHMVFEKNKKNVSCYDTPFGNLLIGITATDIDMREEADTLEVSVTYSLEVNYEFMAECTIHIMVSSKDSMKWKRNFEK